jgi:hypothetical protein
MVLLLKQDLHLIENKLQFLSPVHRTISLYLHFLQQCSCLTDILPLLFPTDHLQNASCMFHLQKDFLGCHLSQSGKKCASLRFLHRGKPCHH